MGETVKLILSLSISGGLFALVLFALKPFIRNSLSKSFQYYIWLVVLLRFILPFSFGINLMDFTTNAPNEPQAAEETIIPDNPVNPAVNNNITNNSGPIMTERQPQVPEAADSAKQFDIIRTLADNLLWIWLVGAVISAAWNILGYLRFIRYIHGTAYAVEMPDCGAKVYKSRFAPIPMLAGVFRPRIYLPDIDYTDGQLNNILLHELAHLRRRDGWLKWFAALVVSTHWFNPIVYFMRREFNRACELSCDEAVIRKLGGTEKQSYGDTLISVVAESRYPVSVMSVTMCEEKKKLKERLIAIMNYRKKTKITVLITAVLAVVITSSAFAFGASVGAGNINSEALKNNDIKITQNLSKTTCQINKIMPNEAICLGKSELSDGVKYTLTMSAESGNTFFAALSKSPNITAFKGAEWFQLLGHGDSNTLTTSFTYTGGETYYIYVGSLREALTNVNVVITLDYIDEEIQDDTAYSISLADLRQLAAKGDELIFEDFNEYKGQDVGFGLYILYFRIEGGYELFVGGGTVTGKPMYAALKLPGVEEDIDIRYGDIDEFIGKYPVPNELSRQIYGYLDTIMSSPLLSSAAGDYIEAHLNEYAAIWNMGETALPTLTAILNSGDMSLRGNIAALLVQDIITAELSKSHSDWLDGVLQSAASDVERWSRGFSPDDSPATRSEEPDKQ